LKRAEKSYLMKRIVHGDRTVNMSTNWLYFQIWKQNAFSSHCTVCCFYHYLQDHIALQPRRPLPTLKMTVFWDIAPCSLVQPVRRFRCTNCLHHQGDEWPDGGSKNLWNVGQFLPDCTAQHPTCCRENLRSRAKAWTYIFLVLLAPVQWV
jgi:hypothetical protein